MKKKFNKFSLSLPNILSEETFSNVKIEENIKFLIDLSKKSINEQENQIEAVIKKSSELYANIRMFIATFPNFEDLKLKFPFSLNPR